MSDDEDIVIVGVSGAGEDKDDGDIILIPPDEGEEDEEVDE